jgi:leucyl-tRNA synthetase
METSNGASKYDPKKIEEKWQKYWEKHPELYLADEKSGKEKKYILDMFPYPSGEGLHVGHVESFTATDIISRYLRMNGKNVLHPTGWDAFGLPAENYAIKVKTHPSITTQRAINNFRRQMKMMGFSYDFSREVDSTDPEYYKWTQWFFLLLYKNGLAYKKKAKANWCNFCKTVLANEQVVNGNCERCGNPVMQKDLEQWFFKITDFIEPSFAKATDGQRIKKTSGLLDGTDKADWPESTKLAQKNWIGKSEGAVIKFQIKNSKFQINSKSKIQNSKQFLEAYTTRLDTIYGCTYCVIAPEHELVRKLKDKIENWGEVEKYIEDTKKKSDLTRMEAKDKTGIELKGIKVINPFTNEELPLFAADYVLVQYGTGAVMAVPAHDERDFEFAKKYDLPIKEVIVNKNNKAEKIECFTDDGELVNSDKYTGLTSEKAREEMTKWLEKNKLGARKINYKIRDWLISRQRYWGAPIPIIYCEKCGEVPVPEKDLPVMLPTDVDFKPTGESPLVNSKEFHSVKCPKCGVKARRESDTMDTFVCSSWYFFRYADPKNEKEFASKKAIKEWMPVDLYVGGAEHIVLHLLYSRFFTKVLHNLGYIDFDEPFLKLRHQGIILGPDSQKMSKSKGNVINPDDEVKKWGADTLRLFEMFLGPLEDMKPWDTRGIVGTYRFLEKVWKLQFKIKNVGNNKDSEIPNSKFQIPNKILNPNNQNSKTVTLINKTIKKVSEDIDNLRFNTAISALMILTNELDREKEILVANYKILLTLLSPFAPFIAEELWEKLGHKESIFKERWPQYELELIKDEEIELVIQVNGKVRDKIKVSVDLSEDEAKKLATESEKIKTHLLGKEIKKVIFIKGRLINIVV